MAHAQSAAGIKNAIRAGVRSIEHGIFLDEEAIDMMLEHDTFLVPTLAAPRAVITEAARGAGLPPEVIVKAHAVVDIHTTSISKAIAAGVKIAMGTDSGVGQHGDNLVELALMVQCGMTPLQAITASTSTAADLLGIGDELGSIEIGKRADLVLIEGGIAALEDLGERIRGIWKDGQRVG